MLLQAHVSQFDMFSTGLGKRMIWFEKEWCWAVYLWRVDNGA